MLRAAAEHAENSGCTALLQRIQRPARGATSVASVRGSVSRPDHQLEADDRRGECLSAFQPVACLANRQDVPWLGGIVLELPSQLGDVGVHRSAHDDGAVSPNLAHELLT